MNEAEKRRRELLEQTRYSYQESGIPAIHPRYRASYSELYGEEEAEQGSLGIRTFICMILFAVFVPLTFVLMDKIAHTNQQVGLASAMAVVLLLIIFAATILQKLFFKLVFRSSDADNEEYTRRKRLRRERRWKKEAV